MDRAAYSDHIRRETALLVAAARTAAPDAAIPSCPGWDMHRLLGHVTRLFRWSAALLEAGGEFVDPGSLPRGEQGGDRVRELEEAAEHGVAIMAGLDGAAPAWNWSDIAPHVAGFWSRRITFEVAVHRWDAEAGAGARPTPLPPDLAVDGVEEFADLVFPRAAAASPELSLGGTVHLHATDTTGEWLFRVEQGRATVTRGHEKGDVAARGTASELFFFAWNRLPASALELFGNTAVLEQWQGIRL